jgi:hypothetical protein
LGTTRNESKNEGKKKAGQQRIMSSATICQKEEKKRPLRFKRSLEVGPEKKKEPRHAP